MVLLELVGLIVSVVAIGILSEVWDSSAFTCMYVVHLSPLVGFAELRQ